MNLLRFFYDDGASDGGSGGANQGDGGAASAAPAAVTPEPLFTPDELKEMGYETPEAAKEAIKGLVQKSKIIDPSEEDKIKQANLEHADMLKYAAQNDLINDDFKKYDSLKSANDRDLVFNKFASEFKEDNPDIPEDKIEEETKAAFDMEFKLGSTNPKEKIRGEARLSKEAKEIRQPAETAFKTVKEGYEFSKSILQKGNEYSKIFKDVVTAVPDKMDVFSAKMKKDDNDAEGEELAIDVELTKEEKTDIEKTFNNQKTFRAYLEAEKEGKLEDFKKNLNNKIIAHIKKAKEQDIYLKIADKAKGLGMKWGSDVGAGQPFAIVKDINEAASITKTAQQEAVASTRKTGF